MTDLEICKRIAEIEKLNYVEIRGNVLASNGFSCDELYNPLTNNDLIFRLAFKRMVRIDYYDECVYVILARELSIHRFCKDNIKSLRRAICLAIIKSMENK